MLLQEAIKLRILELADERGYSVNKLAERSGIAPSVLKKTVKPYATTKNTSTEIVARICVGLGIPFKLFGTALYLTILRLDNKKRTRANKGCRPFDVYFSNEAGLERHSVRFLKILRRNSFRYFPIIIIFLGRAVQRFF